MDVLLYRVGRNLNRAYRTAEAFGVARLLLLDCDQARLSDNLFGAAGRVVVESITEWPTTTNLLALEPSYRLLLRDVDWTMVTTIALAGESASLPNLRLARKASIPMLGHSSCLTVEAALAVALYEWRRNG